MAFGKYRVPIKTASVSFWLESASFKAQVRENCPGPLEGYYRHISKGAWPFSTRDHGWPIADCSAEGLKVIT